MNSISFGLVGLSGSMCVTVTNFTKVGRTTAEIWRIPGFQDGGRPPSWICCVSVWTIDEEYLMVLITVFKMWLESMQLFR